MTPDDLQRLVDASPVHRWLRLHVDGAGDAAVTLRAEAGGEHTGEDRSTFLHGGVVATLLDTAATFALIQATGTDWGTVDLRIDFLRPAPAGHLLVDGQSVHAGTRLGRATARLTDLATGRLLASAAGTFVRSAGPPEQDDEHRR